MPVGDFFRNQWQNAIGQNPERSRAANLANRYSTYGGVLGPAGSVGGAVLGLILGARQQNQANTRADAWTAANGGLPADLAVRGSSPPATSLLSPSPLVSGQALSDFQQAAQQNLNNAIDANSDAISSDTLNGRYGDTRLAPVMAGGTGLPQISGGSDSRTGFSALTQGGRTSTTDVGGVLSSLGALGTNDRNGLGDNLRGRSQLHQRIRDSLNSPDPKEREWALAMQAQLQYNREFSR